MNPRIAVIALATFAFGTQTYVFSGLLAELAADLGVGVGRAGQLSSVFAVVYALSAPLLAGLIAPLERKRILTGALAALFLINLMAAHMPTFEGLLTTRVLAGLASALVTPVAFAAAVALTPEHARGRALALVMAGMTLAFVVGIPLGSVVGDLFGWRATFTFSGLLAGTAALGIGLVLPRVPSGERSGPATLLIAFRPQVLGTLLCSLVAFSATFAVVAFIGPVVNAVTGFTGDRVGAMQLCVGAGGVIGVFLGGFLADRSGSGRTLTVAFTVIAVNLAFFSLLMGADWRGTGMAVTAMALALFVSSAAMFSIGPVIQNRLINAAPRYPTVVLALNAAFIFFGQGLGAAIGGLGIQYLGLGSLGLLGGTIALAGAGLAALAADPTPATAPERGT
ncbi:MFS transporter [Ectothiorhodospiraceae bacterium WFHF3C12]|nr:MFS transporter [Ectothiorhodospiraceae bacterium WFHF3C12]